jgi:hypothetical protein
MNRGFDDELRVKFCEAFRKYRRWRRHSVEPCVRLEDHSWFTTEPMSVSALCKLVIAMDLTSPIPKHISKAMHHEASDDEWRHLTDNHSCASAAKVLLGWIERKKAAGPLTSSH